MPLVSPKTMGSDNSESSRSEAGCHFDVKEGGAVKLNFRMWRRKWLGDNWTIPFKTLGHEPHRNTWGCDGETTQLLAAQDSSRIRNSVSLNPPRKRERLRSPVPGLMERLYHVTPAITRYPSSCANRSGIWAHTRSMSDRR